MPSAKVFYKVGFREMLLAKKGISGHEASSKLVLHETINSVNQEYRTTQEKIYIFNLNHRGFSSSLR